ncbi:uncharacterized protein FIBRA_03883 [Fibroporia radiculosa]|uniref:Transcription factor BYE1 n=1 Tax=Fibroporia radiculosa TaxID=599839 RepID=J4GNQ8_9APHY|nr:uncharacterized protein FIBRA_03883 [Fibroporia radiculosa]CCM01815.1 predicted protein [Fibroporia radiculosa]
MTARPATRSRPARTESQTELDNKENTKIPATVAKGKSKPRVASKASQVHCSCRKPDDGSPMIRCEECKEWYHFRCIDLSDRDAEDILEWEGVDGMEQVGERSVSGSQPDVGAVGDAEEAVSEKEIEQSDTEEDSGDEYVAERTKSESSRKRRLRRVSASTDTESEPGRSTKTSRAAKRVHRGSVTTREASDKSQSHSPIHSGVSKRKQSTTSEPPAKRARSESGEDPTRKYCLTKFQELFCSIFLRYPFLRDVDPASGENRNGTEPDKKEEYLTDEEKEKVQVAGKRFALELEECVHDMYSEPDKSGKRVAAGKYKERFRMLSFNLSKPDRVLLHKRIASAHLTPKELSTMSSTDLADEETKQSIRQAEQEALAHSILKKQTLPRAKITHKGIENIEDVNGAAQRDIERVREEEEEERIEKERQARLRLQAERARSASTLGQGSVPPESPVVSQTSSWGAPPSVPMQPLHMGESATPPMAEVDRPAPNPSFVPPASDYTGPVENELNLADLINIDDEFPPDVPATTVASAPVVDGVASTPVVPATQPPAMSSTGISPFAAPSAKGDRPSFDLNAIWTSKDTDSALEQAHGSQSSERALVQPDAAMDMDVLNGEADDQDFDMFLGKDEDEKGLSPTPDDSPEAQRAVFEILPKVWTGTLSMPLDAAVAQSVSLTARQTGGRTLGDGSPLWRTLFPTQEMRIDGRVPVDKSAQYLTQMRLNPSKELIAVTFSPDPGTGGESAGFQALVNHLVGKSRHGLVFPWGNRPKEWAPGRELYIVPLLSTDAIPDYMELLDDLRLPKSRSASYLVGIWVLTKGKLAPPPTPPAAPYLQVAPPPSAVPQVPQASTSTNVYPQPPAPTSLPQSSPADAALAAGVAQLTPEQIQAMLRTLTSSAVVPPQPIPSAPSHHPTPPVLLPQVQQAIPLQPWLSSPTGFAPPFQPPAPYPSTQPPQPPHAYTDIPHAHYEQDRPRPPPPGFHHERDGDRSHRSRGGGRNRGRSRGRDLDRPRDTGWPKGRGRGRGGMSSPPRGPGWNEQARWS